MNMAPLHLEILLHHYVSPAPWEGPDNDTVSQYHRDLIKWGLIELDNNDQSPPDPDNYRVTPRGAAHLHQVLNLDLPTPAWVNSEKEVILVNTQD